MTVLGNRRTLAIDPGGEHIGWAIDYGGAIEDAGTFHSEHGNFYRFLVGRLKARYLDEVVVERFQLQPGKAQAQSWGEFPTVKCIGVIEYLCGLGEVPLVLQGPNIKTITRRKLPALGITLLPGDDHCKDAQLHAVHRRLKRAEDA